MRKTITFALLSALLASVGAAQDFHVVKKGENLSQIVKNKFDTERLYGRNGKLKKILFYNPQIINSNSIYPNQKVYWGTIVPPNSSEVIETIEKKEINTSNETVTDTPAAGEWTISSLYGAKFISLSQTGALGEVNLGVISFNNFKFNSEFIFDDWTSWLAIDVYKLKYETISKSLEERIYSVDLGTSFRWLMVGIGLVQNPIFRNSADSVDMGKTTVMSLSLGGIKKVELQRTIPTELNIKGWVNYPLFGSTDMAGVDTSSVNGFGLHGHLEFNRQVLLKKKYALHATWQNNLDYQDITQNINGDSLGGKVYSQILAISTSLGLLIKF